MSDTTIQLLESEKAKRISALYARHPEVVDEVKAIFTIGDTIDLLKQPVTRARASRSQTAPVNDTPAPDGFVLSDEVRRAIRQITSERFRASAVYDILQKKYPEYITPDKKPRIGATLSNLVGSDELDFEKDGQRKTWYRVLNLREVPKTDLEFITEIAAETAAS